MYSEDTRSSSVFQEETLTASIVNSGPLVNGLNFQGNSLNVPIYVKRLRCASDGARVYT